VLPSPRSCAGRQLLGLHCGGAQRGREGPFRAEVTRGEGLALTRGSPESPQPCKEDPHKTCSLPFKLNLSGSLCGCPGWVMPALGRAVLEAKNSKVREARFAGHLRGLLQPHRAFQGKHPPPSQLHPHHLSTSTSQRPAPLHFHCWFWPQRGVKTLMQSTEHLQEADSTELCSPPQRSTSYI